MSSGWKFDASLTMNIGKLAVETGMWPLYEIENGVFKLSSIRKPYIDKTKRKPLEEYLKLQEWFGRLSSEELANMRAYIDEIFILMRYGII